MNKYRQEQNSISSYAVYTSIPVGCPQSSCREDSVNLESAVLNFILIQLQKLYIIRNYFNSDRTYWKQSL